MLTSFVTVPAFTTGTALGFIMAGTNSDLFGRRIILIFGNALCSVGFIICATARGSQHLTAGLAIAGFGAGFAQMSMCAIPELMPNKYRHIGICLADGLVFVIVIIGPIVGRYAIDAGSRDWQYIYWAGFICQVFSLGGVIWLYHPPKHPRGVPWADAIRGLDYVGSALVVAGICLTLVGIINTTVSVPPCHSSIVEARMRTDPRYSSNRAMISLSLYPWLLVLAFSLSLASGRRTRMSSTPCALPTSSAPTMAASSRLRSSLLLSSLCFTMVSSFP